MVMCSIFSYYPCQLLKCQFAAIVFFCFLFSLMFFCFKCKTPCFLLLRELLSLLVLRCLGRNGPVICLVEVQHYNAVESRTILVSFKNPYLSQKEGSFFMSVHTNMYFVGDHFLRNSITQV